MYTDLTNLLPEARRRASARAYAFRLGTVASLAAATIIIIHGILLAPTYIFVSEETELRRSELAALSKEREASGFEELAGRVASLSVQAGKLLELPSVPSASDSIRAILDLPRAGITLRSFSYAASQEGGTMKVTGIAATRESLRSFDGALGKLEFVRSTDLPLSAYAKERDIPFSIALALDFTP